MKMPELPPYIYGLETGPNDRVYTEADLRAYGRAVQEECARVCEEVPAWNMDDPGETAAAAIRKQD